MLKSIKKRYDNACSSFWPTKDNWLDQVLLGAAIAVSQAAVYYVTMKLIEHFESEHIPLYIEPMPESLMEEADRLHDEQSSDKYYDSEDGGAYTELMTTVFGAPDYDDKGAYWTVRP